MDSLKAQLLVAIPQLPDTNFYRTVVLMIQHDEKGAFGVVLNRPTDMTIGEIWDRVMDQPCENEELVNLGGPVEGPLLAVHTDPECSEGEVMPGVYVATDRDLLSQLIKQLDCSMRVFSGYSGWGGGQLEGELEAGGWLTLPARREYIFHDDADLWKTVVAEIGTDVLRNALHIEDVPDDPSLN